ncbi:hypothetical protein BP5796_00091 [Coleophoma crateriformis]|uniref:Uncharacterized protein n=1 Tax=Coleophoma crateriformis TaxID=565419 RepID=A0A3D8T8K1_9HELO|nr:hypothetical protein BP5796_00091 [Coleophoma crateriformis]
MRLFLTSALFLTSVTCNPLPGSAGANLKDIVQRSAEPVTPTTPTFPMDITQRSPEFAPREVEIKVREPANAVDDHNWPGQGCNAKRGTDTDWANCCAQKNKRGEAADHGCGCAGWKDKRGDNIDGRTCCAYAVKRSSVNWGCGCGASPYDKRSQDANSHGRCHKARSLDPANASCGCPSQGDGEDED